MIVGRLDAPQRARVEALLRSPSSSGFPSGRIATLKEALKEWACRADVCSIEKLIVTGKAAPGRHFTAWTDFTSHGLTAKRWQYGQPWKGELPTIDASLRFDGVDHCLSVRVNPQHFTGASAFGMLKGKKRRLLVIGMIEAADGCKLAANPYAIATAVAGAGGEFGLENWPTRCEYGVEEIGLFPCIGGFPGPILSSSTPMQIDFRCILSRCLGDAALTEIRTDAPFDIVRTELLVDGSNVVAAFLLNAAPHGIPMTREHLGPRAEVLEQLFASPADLLVIQHDHEVRHEVHVCARVFAEQFVRPRKFCIIHGGDTRRLAPLVLGAAR